MDSRRFRSFMLFGLGVVVASFVGCPACEVEVDEEAVSTDDQGQPDWTSYRGLHIVAHRWFTVPNKPEEYSGYGPVDLLEFENAVYSDCYHAIAEDKADEYLHICDGVNIDGPGTNAPPEEYCAYALCAQQLSLCAGYKNLELADAVGAVEFSTTPLTVLSALYDRGRVLIEHEYVPADSGGPPMRFDNMVLRYKVPPQAPGDRTLLYEAAMEFFRQAGIVSGEAIEVGCLRPRPLAGASWDDGGARVDTSATGSNGLTKPLLGAAGFHEAVLRFQDALTALTQNEGEVGSQAAAGDTRDRSFSQWNGEVNSRLSVAIRYMGPLSDGSPDGRLPASSLSLETEAQREAASILRASNLDLWSDLVPDEDLPALALQSLREQLRRGLGTGDADAGDGDAGGSGDGGTEMESVEAFMARRGLALADFVLARRYLRAEAEVFRRPVLPVPGMPSGPPLSRTAAHEPAPLELPALLAYHTSAFERVPDTDVGTAVHLDDSYGRQGALQSLVYFRDAAVLGLAQVESDGSSAHEDIPALLSNVTTLVDAVLGKHVVEADVGSCGPDKCEVIVRVFGAATAAPNPARAILAVDAAAPRDAYECLRSGGVAGVPCDPRDYVVDETTVPTPSVRLGRSQDALVLHGEVLPGMQFHVFLAEGSNVPLPLASFTMPAGTTAKALSTSHYCVPATGPVASSSATETRPAFPLLVAARNQTPLIGMLAEPKYACTYLDQDHVPPLENELTEDSDPYENSWRHYLEAASQLATEADTLGQQMLDRGLQMDMMAEDALAELREICGDVADIDWTTDETDPAVQRCLGGELVDVLLGDPACVRVYDGQPCGCPESTSVPDPSICQVPCPLFVGIDEGPRPGASAADYCRYQYVSWRMPPGALRQVPDAPGVPTTFRFFSGPPDRDAPLADPTAAAGHALSVFPTAGLSGGHGVDCQAVRDFRCAVETYRNLPVVPGGCDESTRNMMRESWGGAGSSSLQGHLRVLFGRVRSQAWFNSTFLEGIASGLVVVPEQLHEFRVVLWGEPLWSTADAPCPPVAPYSFVSRYPGSATAGCSPYPTDGDTLHIAQWWKDNYSAASGRPLLAHRRAAWATDIQDAVTGLFWLTGHRRSIAAEVRSGRWGFDAYEQEPAHPGLPLLVGSCDGSRCWGGAFSAIDADGVAEQIGYDPEAARALAELVERSSDAASDFWIGGARARTGGGDGGYLVRYEFRDRPAGAGRPARALGRLEDDLVGRSCPGVGAIQTSRGDEPPSEPYYMDSTPICANPLPILKGLELACHIAENAVDCASFDPTRAPTVSSPDDLPAINRHLQCAADTLYRMAGSIVLSQVPADLVRGFRRAGYESYFPGTQGRKLEAFLAIEAALDRFKSAAEGVRSVLYLAGQRFELYRHEVAEQSIRTEMERIELAIRAIQNSMAQTAAVFSAVGGGLSLAASPSLGGALGIAATLSSVDDFAAIREYIDQLRSLAGSALAEGVAAASSALMMDVAEYLDQLRQASMQIADALREAQVGINTLHSLRREASAALARARFETSDAASATYHVNSAMRNWLSTDRVRYQRLLDSAKRMAFTARRAIEFRLGVDMRTMDEDLYFVPAPRTWVDDICRMRGMDYDALSGRESIRGSGADAATTAETDAAGEWLALQERWNGRYVGGYVGDYVRDLQLFVESYPMRYPFTDGTDVAVLSLKDDLLGIRVPCDIPSYNKLRYSYDLGQPGPEPTPAVGGWRRLCAGAEEGLATNVCLAVTSWPILDRTGLPARGAPYLASRLMLQDAGVVPSSADLFVEQVLFDLRRGGRYALSWWARGVAGSPWGDPAGTQHYRVEVWQHRPDGTTAPLTDVDANATAASWNRQGMLFTVPSDADAIAVRVLPAVDAVEGMLRAADLLVTGMQLEEYRDPTGGDTWSADSIWLRPYEPTDGDGTTRGACPDEGGVALRSRFRRVCRCPDREGGECVGDDIAAGRAACAYVLPGISIPLDAVDRRGLLRWSPMSFNNFNYRIEEVGLNIVGTNVRICDPDTGTESCYGAAYLPYTFAQAGPVQVRDHGWVVRNFLMPAALIRHGKGLAAEVFLTNPLTPSHASLMAEYMKDDFRGRPVQANYAITLWDDGRLNWDAVEDIQLVLRYRYWSRME